MFSTCPSVCSFFCQQACERDILKAINPLDYKGIYSATWNNTKLAHWPLMSGLLHLVRRGGTGRGRSPPRSLLAVPNVTASPSINGQCTNHCIDYDGPLLCGFDVAIKGLMYSLSAEQLHSEQSEDEDKQEE